MRLGCTHEELQCAILACWEGFPLIAPSGDKESATAILGSCSALANDHGGTVEGWLWNQPLQRVVWLSRETSDSKASGAKSGKFIAMAAFRKKLNELLKEQSNG